FRRRACRSSRAASSCSSCARGSPARTCSAASRRVGSSRFERRTPSFPGRRPWIEALASERVDGHHHHGHEHARLTADRRALAAVWIVYSAARRLADPPEVDALVVLIVALAGMAVNIAATAVLARASRESINVRGAYVHVATDLAAFAGTALAAGLILATGW